TGADIGLEKSQSSIVRLRLLEGDRDRLDLSFTRALAHHRKEPDLLAVAARAHLRVFHARRHRSPAFGSASIKCTPFDGSSFSSFSSMAYPSVQPQPAQMKVSNPP